MRASRFCTPEGCKEILAPLRGANKILEPLPGVARFALNPWLPSLHPSGVRIWGFPLKVRFPHFVTHENLTTATDFLTVDAEN